MVTRIAAEPPPPARSLVGHLRLRFAADTGRTRLASAERTPPWQLQRLLYLDRARPVLARAMLLNSTAGLFAGDDLTLDLTVEAGAAVEVGSPAMTRAFAMPSGSAHLCQRLTVERDGYLAWLPEPLLLCRDAAIETTLRVSVAAGSLAAIGEAVAFGREAHGDLHQYRHLRQQTAVVYADRLVLADALDLDRQTDDDAPTLVGDASAMGTLYLLGSITVLDQMRVVLTAQPAAWGGASLLAHDAGVAVRLFGSAPSAVQATLRDLIACWREVVWPTCPTGALRAG